MKDENGHIIYVGKAVNLKNRVRQYFQSSRNQTAKTRSMVPNIREFEYIVTDSEMEALLLECNLIKKHHPYYNILLKDDKSYPYIKVTVQEMFPRIFICLLYTSQYVDENGLPTNDIQFNPNGSTYAIEGLISPDGRVLGKMGHAERIGDGLYQNVAGNYDMKLFKSMVEYFK